MQRLLDKVVIVTGAGQGLGEGMALRFAREGAKVVLGDINLSGARKVAKAIRNSGTDALALKVDVSNLRDVEKMVKSTLDKFTHIDILVNNAGVTLPAFILDLEEKVWDLSININLKGTYLCSKAVAKIMIEQYKKDKGWRGKIINISSKTGKVGGLWLSAYAASKFGVIGFTQSLALDLAPYHINVNAVCPGIIFTPQWKMLEKKYAKKLGIAPEKVRPYYVGKIPLGREATAEDIANVVAFLASAEADYMTGQAINVTGGQEMH